MSEIEGNFEKELPVPEHNLSTKMSPEAKQILNSIFKEDFEGAEVDTINDISLDIDPELEMKLLFADDYSEKSEVANDDDICNEMGQGKSIDISEQYKPNSKFEADGKTYETDDNVNIVYEKLIENDFEPGESKEDLDKMGILDLSILRCMELILFNLWILI